MTEASSKYFRQVAGDWDSIRAGYFGEDVRKAAVAKAYLRPEMVVADIGAGTGFMAAGLAPLVRRVYVVDGSAEMLEVARKNLSAFDNVEFHEADGLHLPFPDESLDAVFANMYLHHTPEPLAALREMVRVLVPGGRVVITDMDAHPFAWLKEEMADVWQGFAREDVRGWFREAGLVNVIVDCTGESCCAKSTAEEQRDDAQVSIFVATGTRRLAMREAVQATYSGYARGGSCGCSSPAAAVEPAAADTQPAETQAQASCCGGTASTASSCCGSAAQEEAEPSTTSLELKPLYSDTELSSVPASSAEIPLGCGNPVAIANLKPGEVVLDIGSGGGLDAFLSARRVGAEGRVIGVDMTPAMLERARNAAKRGGITNVEFREGQAESLPVEDGVVDVIISNCVINLTEDKGQVFREAFRALKPGGRLEVSDIVAGGALPFQSRVDTYGWSECITGALPEREYVDLIKQAGFQSVRVRRSASDGGMGGVPVYSAYVSARKPE